MTSVPSQPYQSTSPHATEPIPAKAPGPFDPSSSSTRRPAPGASVRLAGQSAPVPLPQLDPEETKSDPPPSGDIAFRHSWWAADRTRVELALGSIFPDSLRLDRFRSCGDAAWVFRHAADAGRYKICSETCRDRWCRPCQRDRARIIVGNLRSRLTGQTTRLITLTLRHKSQSLRPMVDRLLQAFRTLRARKIWTDSVNGGVAFIEIKWTAGTSQWHPHVHAICSGSYLYAKALRAAWYAITGDSFVCDIRLITNVDDLAKYVVKYATKPLDTGLYRDSRRLHEAINALRGRHLALTFGEFRGWKLTAPGDGDEWVMVASLSSVRRDAANGDEISTAIIEALCVGETGDTETKTPP